MYPAVAEPWENPNEYDFKEQCRITCIFSIFNPNPANGTFQVRILSQSKK